MNQDNSTDQAQIQALQNQMELKNALLGGASWFYWIAGLSIINSLLVFFKTNMSFVVGLGITMIFDYIGQSIGGIANIVTLSLTVLISLVFIAFGYFASKGHSWVFIFGMILYTIDGLLFLTVMDWLAIGFHAFVLFCLYGGLQASFKMKKQQLIN